MSYLYSLTAMLPEPDHAARLARAQAVAAAKTEDFATLIRLARLDPKCALRFENWSGVDFSGSDLRGFDFTAARLNGCRFDGALIGGARFDQAEIDGANLRAANDWADYRQSWVKAPQPVRGDHLPAGAVFQDAPFGPEMVVVPPGRFWMGSRKGEGYKGEYPQHEVTIPRAIAVGRYAVTFEEWDFAQADKEWRKITRVKPRKPRDEGWGRDRRPVIDVLWEDAQAYAKWLSHKAGQPYRLLSEAEWEYCCRAGTSTHFWWGDEISTAQANYDGNSTFGNGSKGEYRQKTVPVDSFQPNPWGLYQMHGNVWEWCEDVWHGSYEDKPEDLKETADAWTTGDSGWRVLRGGSWIIYPGLLRAAARNRTDSGYRTSLAGFRVARTILTP